MADKRECKICREEIKRKYKHYKLWKALAIVFICLTVLFGTLYFTTGDVFRQTVSNDVKVVNNGDSNYNQIDIEN